MKKTKDTSFIIASLVFYIVAVALMIIGTINDLKIDIAIFNPQNSLSKFLENFGQIVYWGLWGPAFTFIFICRRDLNESLLVVNKLLPFVKSVSNVENKAYKVFNFIYKVITTVAFFVLAGIGWKKLIENVIKNILNDMNVDNLSQIVYFIISFVVAIVAILICSRIDKKTLKKLEALALAGVLLGIFYKIVEECKNITSRVRFREMVAYSNNFLNDDGMSEGKHSPLTSQMAENSYYGAFTPWYKKGDDLGIYSRSDSFPSGHTNYSCTLFLSTLLCKAFDKLKKLAPFAFCVSIVYLVVMGYSRMVAGAHYLTDVAGAAIIGYSLFVIVRYIYNKFINKGIIG